MEDLKQILKEFQIEGTVLSIEPYGNGHINVTYLVVTTKKRYILQKINHILFKDIDKLMHNITLVTEYNRKVTLERGKDPDSECLSLIYTNDNKSYYFSLVNYYRVYKFIENSICYQIVEKPEHFYESAVSFGNFASLLATFDASQLYEILPDFHNTKKRFANFEKAAKEDKMNRKQFVLSEIRFINARKTICGKIVDLLEAGVMPTKVTHNDTKLNNVLFDIDTEKGLAVIDFDTIMPGSICYDFGDSIRFGCNPAPEDEKDLRKVNFQMHLFEEYVKGFLYSLGKSITLVEKDHLVYGALLMTLECGIRFLTDYLEGDTYFRTHRPAQNLDRCRTQLRLVADMEMYLDEMNQIVDKYYNLYCN